MAVFKFPADFIDVTLHLRPFEKPKARRPKVQKLNPEEVDPIPEIGDPNPHNIPDRLEAPGGYRRVKVGEKLLAGVDRFWMAEDRVLASRPVNAGPEHRMVARIYPSGFYCRPVAEPTSSIELTKEDRRAIEKAEYLARTRSPVVVRIQNQGYIDPADDL